MADSSFRTQLHGYAKFENLMSGVESITFVSAEVLSQSSDVATVAIATTPIRTNGPGHCQGTVDLVRGAINAWLLHHIHITCP